jgi:glycosyltransferase involved in cell wall biosynthesis
MFYALFCGVRLFHCRSYLSALQVLITKLLFKNIGFIFDPRSDYPEETAFQKKWSKNSLNYKFWKYLEKQFLKYSDTVIAISDTFDNHIKRIYANAKSIVIYNNVDTTAFDYNEEFRSDYRKIRHIDEKTVFCYSGSLHGNNWNDPEIYCKFIYYYTRWYDDRCLFLFLMPEYCNRELVRALKSYDINERYFLIESPRFTELPKYISAGDICIYFLPYYSPRVGTKFVEYCSVGLPIIVNEKVGGAVELINKFKLGVVIKDLEASGGNDESKTETKLILRDLIERKEEYRKRCREFAKNNFSNKIVIGKYSCVYKNLLLHDKLGG